MKKILLSLAMIAMVSTVAVGATKAYFTSDVTVPSITVATGTLHIKDSSQDWMQPVIFNNLKPGDIIRKWVVIENDGTLDVGTLTVSAVNMTGNSGLLHQLRGWTYGEIEGKDDPNGVQTGYNNDAFILLNNANLLSPANPLLKPGEHTSVQVQFVVPAGLGNDWQNQSVTFDLLFHAQQVPGPMLP